MATVPPLAGSAAAAETPRTVILVLDASGSMWRRVAGVDGLRRGEVATTMADVMTRGLQSRDGLRPAIRLGFVRFGYRYAFRDPAVPESLKCADIDYLAPQAATPRQAEAVAVASGVGSDMRDDGMGWNPKGKTPVTRALVEAAALAPPGGADLVLVTDLVDGEDICDPDPCPSGILAPELRDFAARNIRVTFLVASGLEGAMSGRAERLAQCLGAAFLNPLSKSQARTAGEGIVSALLAPRASPAPAPAPPPPAATAPPPAATVSSLMLTPSFRPPVRWPEGARIEDLGLVLNTYRRGALGPSPALTGTTPLRATPGEYSGVITGDCAGNRQPTPPLTVPSGSGSSDLLLDPAILALDVKDATGRPVDAADLRITDAKGRAVPMAALDPREIRLPPGRYTVTATTGGASEARTVTLCLGKRTDLGIGLDAVVPRLGALAVRLLGPEGRSDPRATAAVTFTIEPLASAEAATSVAADATRALTTGRYRVTPRLVGRAPSPDLPSLEIEVEEGRTTEVFTTLPDAILRVEVRDSGGAPILSDDTRFEVFQVTEAGRDVQDATYVGHRLAQPRRPGRYRVVAHTSRGEASATVDVAPADRSTYILRLP